MMESKKGIGRLDLVPLGKRLRFDEAQMRGSGKRSGKDRWRNRNENFVARCWNFGLFRDPSAAVSRLTCYMSGDRFTGAPGTYRWPLGLRRRNLGTTANPRHAHGGADSRERGGKQQ